MTDNEFIETLKWIEKQAERYAKKDSNLHLEIVNDALAAWKWLEAADMQTIKDHCLKIMESSYRAKKKTDPYASNIVTPYRE